MANGPILDKSKAFAIRTIRLYKHLTADKKEYVISKQLLRSGTSIGANAREAQRGQSKADFRTKLNISLKEAEETDYWLDLLHETDYLTDDEYKSIYSDLQNIIRMLMAAVKHSA